MASFPDICRLCGFQGTYSQHLCAECARCFGAPTGRLVTLPAMYWNPPRIVRVYTDSEGNLHVDIDE